MVATTEQWHAEGRKQETGMPDAITGLWAAATTPTDTAGTIDHAALDRHAQRMLNGGCDGLVLFGCCGAGPSFSVAERLSAAEAVRAADIAAADAADGASTWAMPAPITSAYSSCSAGSLTKSA